MPAAYLVLPGISALLPSVTSRVSELLMYFPPFTQNSKVYERILLSFAAQLVFSLF